MPLLHQLDSDPEVMRYLLGRARTPEEIDAFWAPRCADTAGEDFDLGWWVGFLDGAFLGWWDLGRSDSVPSSLARPSTGRTASRSPERGRTDPCSRSCRVSTFVIGSFGQSPLSAVSATSFAGCGGYRLSGNIARARG